MPISPDADPYFRLRQTAAYVLAQAVSELFPDSKLGSGSPTEDGFYYDFDPSRPLGPNDLPEIEQRMRAIIAADYPLDRASVAAVEACNLFTKQPYKLEILADLLAEAGGCDDGGTVIVTNRESGFVDVCVGPHLDRTGQIPSDGFALLGVSGAYWRGDESRPMLQRVHGSAWNSKEELAHHLWRVEEAKKRDHRLLGKDLDLFSISEAVGPGLILWHPKGAMLRSIAEDFSRRMHREHGYEWVATPHVGRAGLWETSGHLGYYRENMFPPMDIEGDAYYVKPMNCPFHIEIYKSRPRSYRDLPQRYAEFGAVYRYERSGALHGLARVRGFTVDDAHIFCHPDHVEDEINAALGFSLHVLRTFGLTDFKAYLSTRPDKSVGQEHDWDRATEALRRALMTQAILHDVDMGGGAFYGPKIDLTVRDALARAWQLGTIQFDFTLPDRFDLEYIGEDGRPHRPYMVHRALLGSMERFMGVLIEHFAGAFPVWLAPVQATVIPISTEKHLDYAHGITDHLKVAGVRAEIDDRNDRMQAKIRRAQQQKIPYMIIIGDKERDANAVTIRSRSGEELGTLPIESFIERVCADVAAYT